MKKQRTPEEIEWDNSFGKTVECHCGAGMLPGRTHCTYFCYLSDPDRATRPPVTS